MINNIPAIDEKAHSESIAKIFGIESKENIISNWLAFLLDPNRIKSDVPLKAFLSTFLNDKVIEDLDYTDVVVTREYILNNMRRVDIVLQINELIIGIENKIFAALHNDQLNDYHNNLSNIQLMFDSDASQNVVTVLLAPSRNRMDDLKDGIGDTIVTLIILAQQHGMTIEECLQYAYDEIKGRKGKTINGTFIKESDLS
ncbi:PD-(D/E)XK nuclease family protein [Macrococcoides bohemicum]|uniref:PD-(D/E)XK nuclease family protein n=1 Tax=Macrococcoides bohemicum TaxID=1903056 RepID=UPI001FD07677|nr:PD-(D/E)XK nuclease family protein [Macrococcus bohemicus]